MSGSTPHQEIPTHLEVEDRILFGLTLRQGIIALVGLSLGYALYAQLGHLPWFAGAGAGEGHPLLALRIGAGCLPVLAALTLALIQPAGRPLEEWLFALARYMALPKRCVWRTRGNVPVGAAADLAAHDNGGTRAQQPIQKAASERSNQLGQMAASRNAREEWEDEL